MSERNIMYFWWVCVVLSVTLVAAATVIILHFVAKYW